MFMKVLLILLYPVVVLSRLGNHFLGFDRLRLRKQSAAASYWTERNQPNFVSYFLESSQCEGGKGSSVAKIATGLLENAARLYRPRAQLKETVYNASAEREPGISDEIYTLW